MADNVYVCRKCGSETVKMRGEFLSCRDVCACGGSVYLYNPAETCMHVRVYYDKIPIGDSAILGRPVTVQRIDQPYSMKVSDYFTSLPTLLPIELGAKYLKLFCIVDGGKELFVAATPPDLPDMLGFEIIYDKWVIDGSPKYGVYTIPVYPDKITEPYSADYLTMKLKRR